MPVMTSAAVESKPKGVVIKVSPIMRLLQARKFCPMSQSTNASVFFPPP
jgi:hypothetical protein